MQTEQTGVRQRKWLVPLLAIIIVAVVIAGVALYMFVTPPAAPPKKAKVVRVLAVAGPETDVLAKYAVQDFEKKTGITASIEIVSRSLWAQRLVKELIEDAGIYDVVMIGGGDDTMWVMTKGHWIPLEKYLTPEEISKIYGREWFTTPDGHLMGVPQYYNFPMLFYRKDLLEDPKEKAAFKAKYGYDLKVPTNFKELRDVAEFFHRPPALYGYCLGGVDWSIVLDHSYFLYGAGGNYGDPKTGELTLNTPAAVKAMEMVAEMVKFNPPGWETMTFFDCDQLVLQGKVFMYQNWFYIWKTFQEKMPDKIGIAPPVGDAQPGAHLGAFVAVIPRAAPNPEAGAEFIRWMISYDYQKKQALETGNLPSNVDVLKDPEVRAAIKPFDVFEKTLPYLRYAICTWTGELKSGIYEAISKVLHGEMTPKQACDWLQNVKFAGRKAIEKP